MKRSARKGSSIKCLFATLGLLLAGSPLLPSVALADVNDFTVTNFTADYYLTNANKQGELRVVEKISVNFTGFNHGILRAIPESYKNLPLNIHVHSITSDSGAPAGYTTSTQNGNEVLKIGDPNRTVTGQQEYTIDYTLENVVTFYNDHDELYWNVNGDQWDQPFTNVRAILHLPSGLRLSSEKPRCLTGYYGSTASDCTITTGSGMLTASAQNLSINETLSFVAGFGKGYFQPPTWIDYVSGYVAPALQFVLPFLVVGGTGFLWWFKRGRDVRGTGVIIPQYDAPDNLSPLEVGAIVGFEVNDRALTATIIDLAIRKYMRIVEQDGKKLIGTSKSYRLGLVNKDWSALNYWEKELMGGLFGAFGENAAIDVSAMATKLQTEAKNIKKSVSLSLTARNYFVSNPAKYLSLTFGVAAVAVWAVIALRAPVVWGLVAGAIVFGVFYHFLPARTMKGTTALEHIKGLKLYLEVAEKDRIKMLQSPDAPYAAKTDAPAHTVELFEKLLPYAIVLKVENEWAKKFEGMYTSPPDWYAGNYAAFNAGYLVGSLGGGFSGVMNASFSPPRSSGFSGFGGGGFAGGGGGGGGGGGW